MPVAPQGATSESLSLRAAWDLVLRLGAMMGVWPCFDVVSTVWSVPVPGSYRADRFIGSGWRIVAKTEGAWLAARRSLHLSYVISSREIGREL